MLVISSLVVYFSFIAITLRSFVGRQSSLEEPSVIALKFEKYTIAFSHHS